ncbi:iron ABC transporter [Tumebacillus algifaecis]|uniref:Iron ABC transporter n=1 Tax=Tumebacillus algifaecis TaxID=1214604 RepID=A0A223CXD6_9BACL|nr:iron ABC transporter permease [Tumebacillus algifaecis]ASS74049.1 iron ABC transporter [Tumebacillus algifaecis]
MKSTIRRRINSLTNGWLIVSLVGATVLLLPVFAILFSVFSAPSENWQHIKEYLLADTIGQTLLLVTLTGLFATLIGVGLAWLVAAYQFPGKRFFRWALVLPLAVPPYIAAYTYSTMLSYTGIVQTTLRNLGVTVTPGLIDLLSMRGAVFIFTMFLFPYVYLITRSFLERQSGSYLENARLLGRKPLAIFFRVVLPISRPAIIGGVSLVVFEVISDYGVTSYFGINTFSTAIFQTWFGMYDLSAAVRLAAWLMVGLIGFFLIERLLRRQQRYSTSTGKLNPLVPKRLRGWRSVLAVLFCSGVFLIAFLIPVVQLVQWAMWSFQDVWHAEFLQLATNTVLVALMATAVIMVFAVIVANVIRMQRNGFSFTLSKLVTAGYSIPGAILAIGVLSLFIWLDRVLAPVYAQFGMVEAPLVLSLSLVMLVFAYVVRFMATGYNAVESGFEKSGTKYTEASRMLGHGLTSTFLKVDLPLIKGAVLSGAILTFVEIIKELPLVLLLRPFNFETLATKTYQYASDERIVEAAVPALCIILASSLSVAVFHQIGKRVER